MQLSPDQFDDILERAGVKVLQDRAKESHPGLDPRLHMLHELNEELAKGGNAGTHAYEMMAAVEDINTGNTRVLIELIAATVMWKLRGYLVDHPMSVTFQPSDIDDMQRAYALGVKRDALHVTVTLTKKPEETEGWAFTDEDEGGEAREQAVAAPERPVWAIRTGESALIPCDSHEDAENEFREHHLSDALAAIENRYCLHEKCPSTGCNQAEVTSDA